MRNRRRARLSAQKRAALERCRFTLSSRSAKVCCSCLTASIAFWIAPEAAAAAAAAAPAVQTTAAATTTESDAQLTVVSVSSSS